MIDLTEAVDAAARRVLGANYESFDKVALQGLKQELLNVIAPAYDAIKESLKVELEIQIREAYRARWMSTPSEDDQVRKALRALELS